VAHAERQALIDAFDSNWIAPLGPEVDAFEADFAALVGVEQAAALSSGTAGLHLGLLLLGVKPGDEVIVPTLTFAATANAVIYAGARPYFVDCDRSTWTLDVNLLQRELAVRARQGRLPSAVITVDLYGQCADYAGIENICREYSIPILQDAAEALGATYRGRPAGAQGKIGVFSFNGNKIITTSGGGMLVSDDGTLVEKARHLASQAREPALHYEHHHVGYNYRLSNLLAALGRAQLRSLPAKVSKRRDNFDYYRAALSNEGDVEFMPEAAHGRASRWLTCLLVRTPALRDTLIAALASDDIEARPVWKPLHQQRAFEGHGCAGGEVAADLFQRGLCLPSGSNLTDHDRERVVQRLRKVLNGGSS
jgi:dTDP-4-amino-4,6-dideoxygalactose transaminase